MFCKYVYYVYVKIYLIFVQWTLFFFPEIFCVRLPSDRLMHNKKKLVGVSMNSPHTINPYRVKSFPFLGSFATTRQKKIKNSLPYNLSIAERRIYGFMPFPRVWGLCEMQPASSRVWTRDPVFSSHDGQHYIHTHTHTHTPAEILIYGVYIFRPLREPSLLAITLSGGSRFIAWRLRHNILEQYRREPESSLGMPTFSRL